jgi:uncharacterized damage-inducible protein DinB
MTGALLLPEFDHEMANTRKALERIPADRLDFRPHPKSWTLRELAAHLANLPNWASIALATTEMDLAQPFEPRPTGTKDEILAAFDGSVADARAALAGASESDLGVPWSLAKGGHVVFTTPRSAVLRSFVLSHAVHHRGQLTVYLRLVDAPVPGLYGPSADERS